MPNSQKGSPAASFLPWLVIAMSAATLAGAYIFQYGFDLAPCPLCLQQRIPYYAGIGVILFAIFGPAKWHVPLLIIAAGIYVVGAGLGVYHAGIEWQLWEGPATCAGAGAGIPASMDDLAREMESAGSVVRCDEAPWRFLGLSLAGYNVLISLGLMGICIHEARNVWFSGKWMSS